MDFSEKDKFELEKRSEDLLSFNPSGPSADWQFRNQGPCPPASVMDSFCPALWNLQPATQQSLEFNAATAAAAASSSVPIGKPVAMGWAPGILPSGLSHFPADSGFVERAARLSCFGGSNFSSLMNPFSVSEPVSPYSGAQVVKDVSMAINHSSTSGSPAENEQRDKRSRESGEPEFSGGGPEETTTSSSKGLDPKKRKRTNQDMELDQAQGGPQLSGETSKENAMDAKLKGEQNSSTMATVKASGKNAKDSSDAPKEDYIHVRARRGQATNSHSLAERVRREKISERMKFLQDLVPGCSKVTGKAVMLDEIINYVQSLQRQVEFLSMKLAAVNPRLDFNLEGLLSKDLLQPQGGSSSAIGFSPGMIHPELHPSQQGLVPAGVPGFLNPSDALRRVINAQVTAASGFKDPTPQMPNSWDEELHNVVQMTFGANLPLNPQELNDPSRLVHHSCEFMTSH